MRYVSGKEKFRAWRILMTLMLLACMLLGLGASQAFAQEDIQTGSNMLDGSKIEGVKVVWVSRDSTVNNEGQAVSQQELDDTDHLYLATNGHGELSMVYKIEVQFSGQYDYGPGDITITIPAQVWRSRTYEQTGVEGETAGIVEEGSLIGKLELPVPQAPSTRADFNWQLIDGNYVLTNTRTIGATSSVSIEVSIHGLQPIDIVDMSESLPITAHCEVVTNLGNTIELTSTPITAQIDTIAKITGVHKDGELYENRPTGLSDEMLQRLPEGTSPDDYLYIRWYSYHSHEINQPYSLDIEDTLYDAYRMVDGQKVKVTDGIFLGSSNYEGTIYPTEDDTQVDFAAEVVDHEKSNSNGYQYSRTVYVWSAYRKADFYVPKATEPQIVYYFENKIDWHLTETDKATEEDAWAKPADEQKVTTASDKAVLSYAPVRWQRPTGAFSVDKWTEEVGSKDWTYGYALNKLENGVDVDMNYIVRTTGYGYPWTTPQTGEFNYNELSGAAENVLLDEMELDQNLMGTLGWQQITDDFQTFFNFENPPLTAEDFQFKSLRVGTPHKERYGKTAAGKWQYITDSTLPNPDLVIEFQLDGGSEWIHAATATWGEGGKDSLTFVDVNEGAGVKISGSSVIFPENVTDTRHSFISNVFGGKTADKCDIAMIRWDVYPTITMKASPRVQKIVAQLFENTESPSTKFKNDVIMDVYGWVDAKGEGKLVLDNDFDYSRATFAGASYGVHLSKTVSFNPASKENGGDNDTENQWAVLHYTAVATEQSNLKVRADYDEALAEGVIPAETSGIWYDLLPEGVVPLLETVKLRSGDAITNMYTVPDYNGTGRILLVVEADLTPVPTYTNYVGYADKPTLSFDAIYSWKDADELGSRVVNYVAFESTVDNLRHNVLGTLSGSKGENDTPLSGNNKTTPNMPADIAKALTDLDPNTDEGRFVYGRADVNIAKLNYAVSGLEKRVQNDLVGIWTQGLSNQEQVTVYEGHNYTYRLNVSSAANTYTANIIIYDTLENYIIPNPEDEEQYDVTKAEDYAHTQERLDWAGDWQGKGQWRGTLTSVDLKDFIDAGVAPRLYYATLPGLQFADTDADITDDNFQDDTGLFNSGNYDLENEVWTLAQLDENGVWQVPEGVQVSAVAMDATLKADGTPFILQPECDMTAYLHMRAPDDESDEDVWHAKGAYARLMDDHGQAVLDEKGRPVIDWEAALDPANNMYAYNNTRMKCTQALSNIVSTDFRMIRNDYTRVGIVPEMVKVTKEWQDQDNHDGIRPDSVEVTLLRRLAGIAGEAQTVTDAKGQPLTAVLSEENDWTHSFLQVDIVNEDGIRYLYSFEETQVDGYTSQIVFVDDHHYLVRNTHPNEQVEISGQKEWKDNEDALELRPDSITVYLLRDGVKIDSRLVRPDSRGNWSYSFGKRDKYAPGGVEYTYTVEESYVPKYVAESTGYTLLENTYVPYGDLEISKTLVNATQAAADREFTFTLVLLAEKTGDAQDAVPLMESYPCSVMEEVNGEWQAVSAGKITSGDTFTLRGGQKLLVEGLPSESTYEVTEAEEPGFTCTAKNNKGTIRAGQTAEAAFTNTYASSGVLQLSAGKSMTGHAIRKNQFRFEIVDMNEDSTTYGQPIRTAAVNAPENTEGGVGEEILSEAELFFGQLQYATEDDGKTFRYEVREKNQEKDGYIYDDTVYTVDVTVSDNGDGTMTVTPVFTNPKTGLTTDALTFENHYEAQGEVTLKAWKTLEGRALEDGEFTFQLYQYDAESNTLGELISEVTNDAQGNIVFPPLSFDQNSVSLDDAAPATYTYLIREKRGADRTVEYSSQEYVITLSVFDNGDGTLSFAQGTQEAERTVVDCATCAGTGAEYLVIYSMPQWFVDGGSSAVGVHRADTAEKLAQVKDKLCKQCGGFSADNPSDCDRCKGCGLEESYYENGTYVRTRTEGVCVFNGKGSYAAIRLAKDIRRCTDCEGIGKELGGMTITGEVVAPVFENTLKPGDLTVTKQVQGEGSSNPDQTFNFTIKLTGEVPEELEFGITGATSTPTPTPAPTATPTPKPVSNVDTSKQYHATEAELQGQAYAVLNLNEESEDYGTLIFFRSDAANPINPWGNSFTAPSSRKKVNNIVYYYVDEAKTGYISSRPWRSDKNSITSIEVRQAIKPGSGYYFFDQLNNVTSADLSKLDTSAMTYMSCMFNGCSGLTSLDLGTFDTSSTTTMYSMFNGCSGLTSLDLGSFDTSKVTDMGYMFNNCSGMMNLDLSTFDTGKLTNMGYMFNNCSGLTSLDISSFNTGNVTSRSNTFGNCYQLSSVSIGNSTALGSAYPFASNVAPYDGKWVNTKDADTVLRSSDLFSAGGNAGTWTWHTGTTDPEDALAGQAYAALNLNEDNADYGTLVFFRGDSVAPVDPWGNTFTPPTDRAKDDTKNIIYYLVDEGTTSINDRPWKADYNTITYIDVRQPIRPVSGNNFFEGLQKVTTTELSNLDTSKMVDMSYMFHGCYDMVELDLSTFDTSNVERMDHMFYACWDLQTIDLSSFDTSNVVDMSYMFYNCEKLMSIDLTSFNTSNVTDMKYMFYQCKALTELDLSSFDTGKVTDMADMFCNCVKLPELDLSTFDTSNVRNMTSMFFGCDGLTELDLSMFDTSNVKSMEYMFLSCSNLVTLDLSSFNTSNVTDMWQMFYYCESLKELDLSSFDVSNVKYFKEMFRFCRSLTKLDLSSFEVSATADVEWMLMDVPKLQFVDLHGFPDMSDNKDSAAILCRSDAIEKVILGEDTAFASTSYYNYPEPPTTAPYDGTWLNIDTGEIMDSSKALFEEGNHPGTWIWNKPHYTIIFNSGEGVGSSGVGSTVKEIVFVDEGITKSLPFYNYGYDLVAFTDENGVEYSYTNSAVTIPANAYAAGSTVTLTAQWQKRDATVSETGDSISFALKAGETFTLKNLPAGTAYEVWEETPEGWVLVKTENDAGTIEPLKESAAKFTNRYAPNEAQVILRAAKRLDGKAPKDGVYQFTLSGEGMETQEKSSVSGAVVFDAILYNEPGVYIYTISEKAGQDDTIEYDSRSYTAEVTVTDNAKGVLSAAVVYKDSEGNALADAPSFENATKPGHLLVKKTVLNTTEASKQQAFTLQVTFASQGTSWSGTILRDGEPVQVADGTVEVEIRGGQTVMLSDIPAGLNYTVKETGTLPGWTMDGTVQEGTILSNDTVEAAFENTYALKGTAVIEARKALIGRTLEAEEFRFEMMDEAGRPVSSAVNGADGKITFPEITYTEEGTWHYTIHEAAGEDDSISYSEEVLAVTVEMTDVEGEGRLTATVTYDENGDTITNEVKKGSLTISKEVISPNADHRQKQFTFTISLTDALGQPLNGVYALNTGDELMVQNGTGTLQIAHGQTVEISGLPHGANYSVTEAAESGFTHTARNAAHVIDADAPAHASFVNTYHAQGEYIFDGVKTLLGAELEENKFQFELKDGEGYTLETVKNGADGSFAFSTLYFTEEDVGEKQFTVTEVNDGVNGYAYDDTRYTLTLTIADNGDGTLSVTAADMPESGIAFENTYSEETSVQAQKRWVGDEAHPQTRCDVKLVLYAQAGGKDREKVGEKVISADAQGDEMTVVWENLPLFLIEEGQRLDILYSLEEEMLTENGQPLLYKGIISGNAESGFEVINRYASVEVVLEAEKVLTGRTLQESQFLFEVRDESGVVVNATNASDGSITFPALRYIQQDMQDAQAQPDGTLQKTFTYQVAEADGGVNGYVYDDTVYQVQVTVTQRASGEMTAQVTLDAEKMVFRNTVEKTSFSVTKEWQGDEGGLITLTLYQNGEKMEPQPAYTENGGVYTYTDLDKYTEEGKAIVYAAKEKYMDGFMTIYRNIAPYAQETDMIYNGGTIVNRAVTTFRVQKVWEGLSEGEEAPEITLTLYCNGEALDKKTPTPDADGWYIYHNLPLTRNGEAAVYTVVEEPLDGFQASYGEAAEGEEAPACAEDFGTIVNRKIPKTDDNSHIGLWIGLTALSAGMLAMLWKKRKKA